MQQAIVGLWTIVCGLLLKSTDQTGSPDEEAIMFSLLIWALIWKHKCGSRWTEDSNIRPATIKFLEGNMEDSILVTSLGDNVLYLTRKAKATKIKTNKWTTLD